MRKTSLILLIATVAAALSGCESTQKAFGGKKSSPDEFVVYSRPPLSLPPDYSLRPPTPGTARPQTHSTSDMARDALLGTSNSTEKRKASEKQAATTPGLQALMNQTGAITADPGIRKLINEETTILAEEDERFIDTMIFWVDDKPFEGSVVDPKKEQKRIREAQALGKPITEGETEHVRRKRAKKGLLEF